MASLTLDGKFGAVWNTVCDRSRLAACRKFSGMGGHESKAFL